MYAHAIFVLNGDGIISPGHAQRIRQCQRLQVGIVVIRTAQFANLYSLDICPLRPDIRARVQGNCMAQHVGILPRIHDAGLGVNFALLYRVQDFVQIPILVILIGRVRLFSIRNLVKRCLLHRLQFTGHSGQHAHRRQAFLQLITVIQLHLRQIVYDCPVCSCQRHVPGFGFHPADTQIAGNLHQRNVTAGLCIDAVIHRLPALDTDVIQLSIGAFQVQVMPLHRAVRIG